MVRDKEIKTPFAITLDTCSSLLNKTGSWRTERPVYLDRLPPCNHACLAGENIQQWLDLTEEGRYKQENATFEAGRCMSCGNCFECDNCYGVCPDNAVKKLGPGMRFEFKYDYCKGCELCVSECPCGAIKMIIEDI